MIKKATTYKGVPIQWDIPEQTCKDLKKLKDLLNLRWPKMDLTENRLLIAKILDDLGIEEE